jgi:hypothetical protein
VYQVHNWAEVHLLFHREGWTKTRIADNLGMSRNTVTRLLELSEPPRYERAATGSKLDPHKGSIAAMLDVDPRVPATVMTPSSFPSSGVSTQPRVVHVDLCALVGRAWSMDCGGCRFLSTGLPV